jgi:glycosyltransferase involved in cell wall biosynthesis
MSIQTKQPRTDNKLKDELYKISSASNNIYDIVVMCHLRWEFVYQRPQHIISRLSKDHKILFIEEPIKKETKGHNLKILSQNLHILQPNTDSIAEIGGILSDFLRNTRVPIGWFYSASFIPLLEQLELDHIIYDCMDELSMFKGAPQHLIEQEKYLLAHTDVVFTGGKSLYESKKQIHDTVFCFPSSVDEDHFATARNGVALPADIANIPHPIAGYYGVVDERIDLDLLEKTASKNPDVSFVMIGPVVKIQEDELPQASNIHYLGMKPYKVLPNYLKAFDIAMMPFALNDATKFISPTKTLEYMAAGKPIISTKIKDVERDYSHCIKLISDSDDFTTQLQHLLSNEKDENQVGNYKDVLEKTSWSNTVKGMADIIQKVTKK